MTILTKLAEILEEDEISEEDKLRDFDNWDSLSVLAIQSYADKDLSRSLLASDLVNLVTVGDLVNFLSE